MSVSARPHCRLSVCIPAYNRARFLEPLLVSILAQVLDDTAVIEILIVEDASPERAQIRQITERLATSSRWPLRYVENEHNLGFDGNIRRLVELATGTYCFFMGNDDLLAPDALRTTLDHLQRHPQVGLLLRGYAWFRRSPQQPEGTVRYVSEPLLLAPGEDAIAMCFRRSGVISGYIIARDPAHAAATTQFDGTLYYQMHLTAAVLASRPALVVPEVLVLCRDEIPPDFGAASSEYGRFVPGRYTPQARVHMLRGAMQILLAHTAADTAAARRLRTLVARDYARHFYPFVMDQLALPFRDYLAMCRQMANTPVGRHPSFYVNCAIAYALGRRRCDAWLRAIRDLLGRTPRF